MIALLACGCVDPGGGGSRSKSEPDLARPDELWDGFVDPYDGGCGGKGRVIGGDGVLKGACPPGTKPRACYSGPPETNQIGSCRPGVQHCVPVEQMAVGEPQPRGWGDDGGGGPDTWDFGVPSWGDDAGVPNPNDPYDLGVPPEPPIDLAVPPDLWGTGRWEWGPCIGETTPKAEKGGTGRDDDCDGEVDFSSTCPKGEAPGLIVRRQPRACASGVAPGNRWSLLYSTMGCPAPLRCAPGQTTLYVDGRVTCLPPPPACGPDEALDVTGPPMVFRCVPCTWLILYGHLFDGERRCSGPIVKGCPNGQIPKYSAPLEQWICAPPCDNSYYDLHIVNGEPVCVPC